MAVKGGFSVLDLHASDGRLELTVDLEHGPVTFTGVIDVGVVPHGVMGACGHMLRIGIELKYTEAQKKARERQIEGAALRLTAQLLTLSAATDGLTMSYATVSCRATETEEEEGGR